MKILSLQGGGTRGIMQAVMLAAVETSGTPIWQRFDLIGGTSVGALIGGCLAVGVPASKLVDFFNQSAPKIFTGHSAWGWNISRLWNAPLYSPEALRAALVALVGDATLADCKTKFIATAMEMTTRRITYFQSYGVSHETDEEIVIGPDSGVKLVDVMLASAAAQSYFPGHQIEIDGETLTFWDGGNTGLTAPDVLLLAEAKAICPANFITGNIQMLSLGNGKTPVAAADAVTPGIASTLRQTLDIVYSGPEAASVWLAQMFGAHTTRINPVLDRDYGIDDASPATLAALTTAAQQMALALPKNLF